jgi:hypothetical protein
MSRLVRLIAAASLATGIAGCCAGPCRFWQNAYGFENPDIERWNPNDPGVGPPVTTPPGYTTPAVTPPPASVTE